jgi:hypothetical protein
VKALLKLLLFSTGLIVTTVSAASLGTHCWKQEPYAYILCFDVNDVNGKYFSLIGENIIPGKATYPVHGSALLDDKIGLFRLEFTQNLGDSAFQNAVTIDRVNLNGSWTDDGGNKGDFKYVGSPPLDTAILNPSTTKSLKSKKR